ncbi:hypothetical protein BJX61DRAFT_526406 [Aspergillus egyptiacus]|nr:hypothetical protein BJX61DRAFT_526406 [Aspergillus egyptiacus]
MYNASLAFTKFSLLFQYLRIFPSRRFRLICYSVMAVVVLYSSWAVISGFVNCVPVAKFWNSQIPGVCLSFQAVWFFNAAMNIATDVALLILPMPLVSHLHLPRMQKLLLVGVFALGTLVVITSCLRLSSLHSVAESKDTSWANVGAAYWTAAECNVSIICASLPFLRPLISHIFPRFLSTHSNSKTGNRTRTTAVHSTFRRASTFPFTQDPEFGLVTIDTEAQGGGPHSTTTKGLHNSGIEVTMEMIQEVAPSMRPQSMPHNMNAASTSQRRLLLDAQ